MRSMALSENIYAVYNIDTHMKGLFQKLRIFKSIEGRRILTNRWVHLLSKRKFTIET